MNTPQENISYSQNDINSEYVRQKALEILKNLTNPTRLPELVCEVKKIDFTDPEEQKKRKECEEKQRQSLSTLENQEMSNEPTM